MPVEDYSRPPVRRLRVYAFDPQASTQIDTAGINIATIELPWESGEEDALAPGPVNDYLEVIDVDPVSGQFYDPVNLNHPYLLAQDGLAPSEGDPRFHQQMVFAVAMKTIRAFERALGRRIFWAPRKRKDGGYDPVKKLRVYPHALREPNAFYSKQKIALLFGYFRSVARDAGANWVFTALSHDVVVHETTHAILDGLHRRYSEPTSIDSLAFHEAFADIVALLSHFTLSEAVHAEITAHGGQLDQRTLMTGLARQFGRATGAGGALREAIDTKIDGEPDPGQLDALTEPHARGAVLVAAVFEAFLTIYQRRSADLMRLAGPEPGGRSLHPDLVARLAREANKSAEHVLRMCLRSLDYLPPIDVRFGEFLRAIVTADTDLVPVDPYGYRIAMVEAFRRRGIVPEGCLSLAPDSLLWEGDSTHPPLSIDKLPAALQLDRIRGRERAAEIAEANRDIVQKWLMEAEGDAQDAVWQAACGVLFRAGLGDEPQLYSVLNWTAEGGATQPRREPNVEVHSVRTTRRSGPDGQDVRQLVIEVTQRRRGFFDPDQQKTEDAGERDSPAEPDFIFRGGVTLIFDLFEGKLRYAIRKRITDDKRLAAQRDYLGDRVNAGLGMAYWGPDDPAQIEREPFAMVHGEGTEMASTDDRVIVRMYRGVLGDCFLVTVWKDGTPRVAMIDCGVLQNVQPGSEMVGDEGLPEAVVDFVGRDVLEQVQGTKQAVRRIEYDIVAYLADTTGGKLDLAVFTHDHYDHVAGLTLPDDENVFLQPSFVIDKLWLSWTENTSDPQSRKLAARFAKGKQAVALAAEVGRHAMGPLSNALQQVQALAAFVGPVAAPGLPAIPSTTRTTTEAIQAVRAKVGANTRFLEPGQVLTPEEGIGLKTYVLAPPRTEARLFKDSPRGKGEAREVYLTDIDDAAAVASAAISQLHGLAARGEGPKMDDAQRKTFEDRDALDPLPFARPHRRNYPPAKDGPPRPDAEGWPALRDAYEADDNAYRSLANDWTDAADSLALKLDSDTNNSSLVLAFELPDGRVLLFPGDAQVGNWESWGDQLYPAEPAEGERQQAVDDILRRVVFYKVGHHASHNATARSRGLELMTDPRLCAAIPLVEAVAKVQGPGRKTPGRGWKMPFPPLYQRLHEQTQGRIVKGDGDPQQERDAFVASDAGVSVRHQDGATGGLWVELTFPL